VSVWVRVKGYGQVPLNPPTQHPFKGALCAYISRSSFFTIKLYWWDRPYSQYFLITFVLRLSMNGLTLDTGPCPVLPLLLPSQLIQLQQNIIIRLKEPCRPKCWICIHAFLGRSRKNTNTVFRLILPPCIWHGYDTNIFKVRVLIKRAKYEEYCYYILRSAYSTYRPVGTK